MSTTTTLILIQQYMTRYLLSAMLAFGTLGNLLTIVVFSRKKSSHKRSCSIYSIALSSFGLVASWWAIVPVINALDHFDMVNSSLVLCRIRGYTIHVSSMCFRYTLVLLCIDRYASCHPRAAIRALCRLQIALRSICFLTIFWSIVSFHFLVWESIENNRCSIYGLYGQIFSFYSLVFVGIVPSVCMISMSIPLIKKLRQMNYRITPQDEPRRLNKRDVRLMKIVLMEVFFYILCTFLHPMMLIYCGITDNMGLEKSADRKQIESFINFITMSVLLHLIYNARFYMQFATSKTYRKEVKKSIICY